MSFVLHARVRPRDPVDARLRGCGYVVEVLRSGRDRYGVCWVRDMKLYQDPAGGCIAITPIEWWLPNELEADEECGS